MKTRCKELVSQTTGICAFINITSDDERILAESGIREGFLLCNTMHIITSVSINDEAPGLHRDFEK